MNPERFALPGFNTPDHPKADERVFAKPDGSVELVLKDGVPLGTPTPDYHIRISTEYGTIVNVQATARNGNVVTLRNEEGPTQRFVLKLGPPCIQFLVGTYTIRGMVNGCEEYFKHLTVSPHPDLALRTPPNLVPDPGETA